MAVARQAIYSMRLLSPRRSHDVGHTIARLLMVKFGVTSYYQGFKESDVMGGKGLRINRLEELQKRFGERVSSDAVEGYIYSRDMGEFPFPVGKLVGGSAEAVVQVETAEEISWHIDFALAYRIPLTPRAAATSGYGGAIPVQGGIVVDLTRLNHIMETDTEGKTALVQAGVVWWNLEKGLRDRELALQASGKALAEEAGPSATGPAAPPPTWRMTSPVGRRAS